MRALPGAIGATRDGRGGSRRLDLREAATFGPALEGVSAVVHCAVGDRAVTVDGTAALLAAAASAGVGRVVHLSSVAVYAGQSGPQSEAAPLVSPEGQDYAAMKAAAEQACLAAALPVVRLRPTVVYGPGGWQWVGHYAARIRAGRWGTFGAAGEGVCSLLHVDDLARAVAAALAAEAAAGEAFNIDGPEAVTWNEWFARIAAAIGAPPLRPMGAVRARMLAALALKAAGRAGLPLARGWVRDAPSRPELALYRRRATYPTARAQAVLGWQPVVGVAEGLASCVPGPAPTQASLA